MRMAERPAARAAAAAGSRTQPGVGRHRGPLSPTLTAEQPLTRGRFVQCRDGEEALGMAVKAHISASCPLSTWSVGAHAKGKVLQHPGQALLTAQNLMVPALLPVFLETQGMIWLPQVESNKVHQQPPSFG